MRFGSLLFSVGQTPTPLIHNFEQALDKFAWAGPLLLLASGFLLFQTSPKTKTENPQSQFSEETKVKAKFWQIQNWLPILFLLLIAALHFAPLFRPDWTNIRADYDEGVHTMAATLLAQGHWPYRDFFFTQPPAAIYNLLPAGILGGGGPATLWLARATAIAWGLASGWLLFVIGRKVWNWQFGCAVMLIYGLDGIGVFVGHQALLEQIRNGWGLLAIWAFLSYLEKFSPLRRTGERWLIVSGVCAGFAFLSKVDGLAIIFGLLGWCFLAWALNRKFRLDVAQKMPLGKIGLKLALYFAITSFVLVLPFLLTSGGSIVRQVLFFQLLRPPDGITPEQRFDAYAFNPGNFQVGGNSQLTLLLSGFGLLCWLLKFWQTRHLTPKLQALLVSAAIWLSFQLAFFIFTGSFFVHYFLTILPVLALAGGGLVFLPEYTRQLWQKISLAKSSVKNVSRLATLLIALLIAARTFLAGGVQFSTLFDPGESDGPATIAVYLQSVSPSQASVQTFDMLDNLLAGRKLPDSHYLKSTYLIDSYGSLLYTAEDISNLSWLTLLKHVVSGKERQQNYHTVILNSVAAQLAIQLKAENANFIILDERGEDYASADTKKIIVANSVQLLDEQPIMTVYSNEEKGALARTREWLLSNLPRGSKIWIEPASLHLPGDFQFVNGQDTVSHNLAWFASQNYDYLILSSNNYDRYFADPAKYPTEVAAYKQLAKNLIASFSDTKFSNVFAQPKPLANQPSWIDVVAVKPQDKALLNLSVTRNPQIFQLGLNIIKLHAYSLPTQVRAGDILPLMLSWEKVSSAYLPKDTKLFVHLLNAQGQIVAQRDNILGENLDPSSDWLNGETIPSDGDLTLPANLPPGNYQVEVGIYLASTGQRFLLSNGDSGLKLPTIKITEITN